LISLEELEALERLVIELNDGTAEATGTFGTIFHLRFERSTALERKYPLVVSSSNHWNGPQ
jgi:hypothetical protein